MRFCDIIRLPCMLNCRKRFSAKNSKWNRYYLGSFTFHYKSLDFLKLCISLVKYLLSHVSTSDNTIWFRRYIRYYSIFKSPRITSRTFFFYYFNLQVLVLAICALAVVTAEHAHSSQHIHKHDGHHHKVEFKDHHGHHHHDYYVNTYL